MSDDSNVTDNVTSHNVASTEHNSDIDSYSHIVQLTGYVKIVDLLDSVLNSYQHGQISQDMFVRLMESYQRKLDEVKESGNKWQTQTKIPKRNQK